MEPGKDCAYTNPEQAVLIPTSPMAAEAARMAMADADVTNREHVFAGPLDVPFANAGATPNPVIVGVHRRRQLVVSDDSLWLGMSKTEHLRSTCADCSRAI